MRLFHIDLIDVLPRQQLLGQWRELNSIFKKQNKHILINFIYDYPIEDLLSYSLTIIQEFEKRKYKIKTMENFIDYFFINTLNKTKFDLSNINAKPFKNKMNKIYLRQCIYNLEEKAMCDGISKNEWLKIYNKFKYDFDLWNGEV